eukprot:3318160-Rhodomonas_salina.2
MHHQSHRGNPTRLFLDLRRLLYNHGRTGTLAVPQAWCRKGATIVHRDPDSKYKKLRFQYMMGRTSAYHAPSRAQASLGSKGTALMLRVTVLTATT